MPSLNRVILVGRLTRDPEQSYTASNLSIAKFTIAVDRQYKDTQTGERKTDFFDCRAFRQTADFVSQYITKGQLVAVEGRVEINKVPGQDGTSRYFTNIVCDRVESMQGRDENSGSGDAGGGGSYNAAPAARNGGGNGGGRSNAQDDNYFDDEEPAPAPRPAARAATPAAPRSEAPAPRPSAPAQRPAPKPAAKETYPDDDFDDSDPFADE